ncbi:uncharacterized protein NEMAJ01_1973 [Nematocida major]|uniref:uncharacterized protein n=1 Tax=Nematocida major TaxID=1912982 RepID=UPI0020079219|nr:uncharacterized protein NEMAJ01_1973 [Nematocida major]KAH9387077.1 hypothetical protein NEMAJ01_1973 [Nematocida major]
MLYMAAHVFLVSFASAEGKDGEGIVLLKDKLRDRNSFISNQAGYLYNVGRKHFLASEREVIGNGTVPVRVSYEVRNASPFKIRRVVVDGGYPMNVLESMDDLLNTPSNGIYHRVLGLKDRGSAPATLNKYKPDSRHTISVYPEVVAKDRVVFRIFIEDKCIGVSEHGTLSNQTCRYIGSHADYKNQLWIWVPAARFQRETKGKKVNVDYEAIDKEETQNGRCKPCPPPSQAACKSQGYISPYDCPNKGKYYKERRCIMPPRILEKQNGMRYNYYSPYRHGIAPSGYYGAMDKIKRYD